MITYSELFQFVMMLCAVITLVLAIINANKERPLSGKGRRYFLTYYHNQKLGSI